MSLTGVIVNGYSDDYNGRFYVANYDTLPKSWDKIGASGTDYTAINNNGGSVKFGSTKYVVVVVMPTATALTGAAIAFDTAKLLSFASTNQDTLGYGANLIMTFCDSCTNGVFTYYFNGGSYTVTTGTSTVDPQKMFMCLNSYSVTAITDAATGMFPFTIGDPTGSISCAVPNASGVLQAVTSTHDVVVAIKHSKGMLYWGLLLLVVVLFIIAIVMGVVHMKKRGGMSGMM